MLVLVWLVWVGFGLVGLGWAWVGFGWVGPGKVSYETTMGEDL